MITVQGSYISGSGKGYDDLTHNAKLNGEPVGLGEINYQTGHWPAIASSIPE